ncbi:unnamed protein product [Urochloa humidicola]
MDLRPGQPALPPLPDVLAVCYLLVSPAPARRPSDLPPRTALHADIDNEAVAEPLLPKPVASADCCEAADEQGTTLAVPEVDPALEVEKEEPRRRIRALRLCLGFRCGGKPAHAGGALVARCSSNERAEMDKHVRPSVPGKMEAEEKHGPEHDGGKSAHRWRSRLVRAG